MRLRSVTARFTYIDSPPVGLASDSTSTSPILRYNNTLKMMEGVVWLLKELNSVEKNWRWCGMTISLIAYELGVEIGLKNLRLCAVTPSLR